MLRINVEENWRTVIATTVIAVLLVVAWEGVLRSRGYETTLVNLHDTARRYSWESIEENAVVIAGSSQIMADLDIDVLSSVLGRPVYSLGRFATPPDAAIAKLAERPDFKGVILAGLTEYYFHLGPTGGLGPKIDRRLYPRRGPSPSFWAHSYMTWQLTSAFRFRTRPFWLSSLVERAITGPFWPNRNVMTERLEWLIQRDPESGDNSLEVDRAEILKAFDRLGTAFNEEELATVIARNKDHVAALESRGAKLLYLRLPTADKLEQLSNTPREKYWDVFCAEVGALCLHSNDVPEISEFEPPDGIHLEVDQRTSFTEKFAPAIARALQ